MHIRTITLHDIDAVLALWQESCIEAVGHELTEKSARQVQANLRQYVAHPRCFCYIAERDSIPVGFVTGCLLDHPVQPGFMGELEELYVQPVHRHNIAEKLVGQMVLALKEEGAGVIMTRVATDEPDTLTFWRQLRWEQDTVNFTIYSDVPGDLALQAVWDDYKA